MFAIYSVSYGSELKKNGFSITIPEGWVEIPREKIDEYTKVISQSAPETPKYECAFQLASSKNWFEYPYIVVQINTKGRIPYSQLKKIKEYPAQENLEKHKKNLSTFLTDFQAGTMVYDKINNKIWNKTSANVNGIGPVSGLSCITPTNTGYIQVIGNSTNNYFSTYEPVFQIVAQSVSPETSLVYTPNKFETLPFGISSDWIGWKLIMLSSIIFILYALMQKKP